MTQHTYHQQSRHGAMCWNLTVMVQLEYKWIDAIGPNMKGGHWARYGGGLAQQTTINKLYIAQCAGPSLEWYS